MPRAPLTETRPPNASPAPGVSRTRSLKSRPRIGRLSIWASVTAMVRSAWVVSTTGASAVTVICSASCGSIDSRRLEAGPTSTVAPGRAARAERRRGGACGRGGGRRSVRRPQVGSGAQQHGDAAAGGRAEPFELGGGVVGGPRQGAPGGGAALAGGHGAGV